MIKPKDRKHMDFEVWEKQALKDPVFKAEYDKLEPEFAVITAILEARVKKHMTQERLAKKIGTKQSAIARLESGNANPSIGFLQKLADALGKKLVIRFE